MKPILTIAVQVHNFQRRFCWMLSSIVQQTVPGLVKIDVAYMPRNGKPTTENVCEYFRSKIPIRSTVWTDRSTFQYRGLIRNDQIRNCSTEWLMFGDCDMVYHPEYFARLSSHLLTLGKVTYMLSSGRMSNPKELTTAMVNADVSDEACEVAGAFAKADELPKRKMANVGAGFCQLINHIHCPHGGYYVDPGSNADWSWEKGSNPKSDMQFRYRIGAAGGPRQRLPRWFTRGAIHLNHNRDPEAGHHITEQR